MNYRVLGRTGLEVSEVGFGGAPAGLRNYMAEWDPSEPESWRNVEQAIERAVDLGINYFDTAPGYGDGTSERMYGVALKGVRDRVYIATKVTGSSAAEVRRSVEESLERLQTDYVDVIQYHGTWYSDEDVQRILRPGGALAGMQALRDDGLARYIGFTSEGCNGPVSRFIRTGEFDVMQICYNLIFQHPYDASRKAGVMYEAEDQQMGIITMRPMTSGMIHKWVGWTYPEIAGQKRLYSSLLGFVLANPLVDVAIVGMRYAKEVETNSQVSGNASLAFDMSGFHTRYL